ncbi:MAG: hypothetical protein A2600_06675 [Candidatus Lambdaproteobacteria bacterium RIFOXYD1_FULL_56_27]|uniref:Co-chaperone DjlA N-terminal domain-containing protein n=1 Tax=Candidatus Lambdaproteobacteria bacterium RIFOXYD2_FULL_56_26 TaxID=1817773 RepID=A0A1F6GL17_9PROT|nr:MAG: hypothetical protein A2557_13455 [Candidatus Lambdaproteobacteria bacterium RIFOXYD2_FULL_56_26]OGH04213.1 MAG: hypothetical protein A2426_02365 [Candidatus Lambdaproteobacteria bacterium RIFOXYC1_FULL_56_13]OGH08855.1 MAG: hypothetical protein A2600_06675 [Candidatus Lambdaproteobacteria bacterium RIFOXYD1_FULL_56_27]
MGGFLFFGLPGGLDFQGFCMSVPVNHLNAAQKKWYANLVVAAILADQKIVKSEIEFLKQIISVIDNPADKKALLSQVETKKASPLVPPPPGIPPQTLAAIYLELCLIMISDSEFDQEERDFLAQIARLMNFSDRYINDLNGWMNTGLEWKKRQQNFLPPEVDLDSGPTWLVSLPAPQREWYAQVMISTILLDREVDSMEMEFLKAAISLVADKGKKNLFLGYIKNRFSPNLEAPPQDFNPAKLVRVMVDVILLIALDDKISVNESTHLERLSKLCSISATQFSALMAWCAQRVEWNNNRNPLIGAVKMAGPGAKEAAPKPKEIFTPRIFECFICGSKEVNHFHLRVGAALVSNLFGRPSFIKEGDLVVDYLRHKIMVCPRCFFASGEKAFFKKEATDKPPVHLQGNFKSQWGHGLDLRKKRFAPFLSFLGAPDPDLEFVKLCFETAAQAQEAMNFNNAYELNWEVAKTRMDEAEVLMRGGQKAEALEQLAHVRHLCEQMMETCRNDLFLMQAAKTLFFLALYREDKPDANRYLNFFMQLGDKGDKLDPNSKAQASKLLPLVKRSFDNKEQFTPSALDGFHPKVEPVKKNKTA